MLWTNAFENDEPSNWARWNLYFEEAGDYEVEVYIDPDYGVNPETTYALEHAPDADGDRAHAIVIDQGAVSGWVSLGNYPFEAGQGQHLSVYDNVEGAVAEDQHVAVDAVRVTRVHAGKPGGGGLEPKPDPTSEPNEAADANGGCRLGPSSSPAPGWWLLLALGALSGATRRRR